MLSESRKRKLAMLTRSLAKGEIAKAQELLRSHGHTGLNRHGASTNDGTEVTPVDIAAPDNECTGADDAVAPGDSSEERIRNPHSAIRNGPLLLMDACPGLETQVAAPSGSVAYWMIRKSLAQVDGENVAIAREFAAVVRGARQRVDELDASPALCHVTNSRPEDLLFMDVESCGLYGTSVFLIGLMSYQGDELVFEQCLARDYREESAILQAFATRLEETGVLVTFNGKSFDMNMIKDRSAFHRVDLGMRLPPHLDLLHESRRRWKGKLPNCRLQTLEKHLCRRIRYGDIPGWAIPDAYHRFVDGGDARQLADILHHNLLDLLTMAQVLTIILTGCDPSTAGET